MGYTRRIEATSDPRPTAASPRQDLEITLRASSALPRLSIAVPLSRLGASITGVFKAAHHVGMTLGHSALPLPSFSPRE